MVVTVLLMVLCLQDIDDLLREYARTGLSETLAAYVANSQMPADARLRAAMALAQSRDARAPSSADLDGLLFAVGDGESARQLGERARTGTDRDQQLHEVEYLARLNTPAARAALLSVAGDESIEAEIRLVAAERLRATGADPRQVLGSLANPRPDGSVAGAVTVFPRDARPDPGSAAVAKRVPAKPAEADLSDVARARLNIVLASVAVALSVLLLATKRRA
jgi:hypothetical protein